MNAIGILVREHDLIKRFLNSLSSALGRMSYEKHPTVDFFKSSLKFAREFADKHHHHKEEHLMFTQLAQKHHGELDPSIERLRQQHEANRNLLAAADKALPKYEKRSESGIRELNQALAAYRNTLTRHIEEEDSVFFPLVKQTLSDQEMLAMTREFERVDSDQGQEKFEEYERLVAALEQDLEYAEPDVPDSNLSLDLNDSEFGRT